ncbi:Decarboxylase NovR [Pigmentiphaga humi]|uniref:Decarboxylase NovR n=1 Tax=Pigmentiphaga humi TaxID=2478468 RepID=A0A3P4B0X6_9BURK|nr:class II aldolase/adducin family protein [Pigmentiphaga humi]VCU69298.1 Decarboxylase NovR [Pigmentiphaga humi]
MKQATMQGRSGAWTRRVSDLVKANHILVRQGVLDGYGHVSARSPDHPDRFLLARSLAPASVQADDIVELDLDSRPVGREDRQLYLERYIHGEIYRRRPDVLAVVHSHSPTVIPFGIGPVPMRPVCHVCGFIGPGVPLFEIRDTVGDRSDLLIRDQALGRQLAIALDDKAVCLQRGHGAVVVAGSIPQAVARSVYLELNARLQIQAITLAGGDRGINYLSAGESQATIETQGDFDRAWAAWCEEESRARGEDR